MKVSVVVTGYNIKTYVGTTLDSILNQTLQPHEVIFVDDGSEDETSDHAKRYLLKMPRWQVISQNNRGPGGARNAGLRSVTGDYVVFLDGDDWLEPTALQLLCSTVNVGQDAVFSNRTTFMEDTGIYQLEKTFVRESSGPVEAGRGLLRRFAIHGKMFRHRFLVDNQLYFPEEMVWEDYPFSYGVLALANNISIIPSSTYFFRRRVRSSVSASKGRRLTPFYLDSRMRQIDGCKQWYQNVQLKSRFPKFDFLAVEADVRLWSDVKYLVKEKNHQAILMAFYKFQDFLARNLWLIDAAEAKRREIYREIFAGNLAETQLLLRTFKAG